MQSFAFCAVWRFLYVCKLTISGAGQICACSIEMAFETSTTKYLFDNYCYLYISMVLVILEVVFQVFLRLLRIPQYSNQWACETGKHLHELRSLYACAMDSLLLRCYVCLFHVIVSFSKSYYFSFAVWCRSLYR
ncbi:uncharacterized protein LOC115973005 [Quercus lobata]|uniref:uncharacterized protein LOC115973005 n=1 Tax=Quercus lobata TaxID=97700 RepID=UPI0012465A2A|nr:uncharacterized protein LOC115973005 [Quercus lobata]